MSSEKSEAALNWEANIRSKARAEFAALEDGYKYYWPSAENPGAMSAAVLRIIADELDLANADWDAIVQQCPVLSETIEIPFVACAEI